MTRLVRSCTILVNKRGTSFLAPLFSCCVFHSLVCDAKRAERTPGLGLAHPVVGAGQVDVLPYLRRDVADDVIGQLMLFGPQALDDTCHVDGVPKTRYSLTQAGLSPAGTRQLFLAHHKRT